ncbi:MAG TPA: AraC family transcriptional regulator [Alphaproteobacteria bacterium]|jgi:AraC family transcriptional regulator|nr:AraC family transcriptional regulator [Alphaproteobacteria bacterium]
MPQNWTIDAELRTPDIAVVLMAHDATGPLQRTHRMEDHAISLFLTPDYGQPVGRYPGQTRFARFGPLSITPADMPVFVRSPGAPPRRMISCRIDRARFQTVTGLGAEWDEAELAACLDLRGDPIAGGMKRLAHEAATPGFASDLLVEGVGLTVMVEIARFIRGARGRIGPSRGGLAPWQLRRITDAIEASDDANPSLAELAALCGIGRRHLMRAFRQSTGRTITDYAEAARAERAAHLLTRTDLAVADIARQLGFAGASGFSHAFRRVTGEAPTVFRRRSRV